MAKRVYEIWSAGYRATGEFGHAMKHGECEAESFQEACDKWFGIGAAYYDNANLTYWSCHLYDNEADARKTFG